MERNTVFSFLVLQILCIGAAFSQIPAGDRILGMHIGASETDDFIEAIDITLASCATHTHLFTPWSWLEETPGQFDGESVNILTIANLVYPGYGIKVELNICPTNTVTREVPEDLETVAWDDPEMISRYNTLLDSVFTRIPDLELVALMIGNESDILWGNDEAEILRYKTFLEAVKVHAKELYFDLHGTDLLVGTTLTYEGLVNPIQSAYYHELNEAADVISVTYYHFGDGFEVLPPNAVNERWDVMVDLYDDMDKPIYVVECGCPTSSLLGGSEEHQAEFVSEMFTAWDEHYDKIKLMYFFMLHDWSQSVVDELAIYYNLEGVEQFTEFLRTLGLRTWEGDGTDKLGMERYRCEADARSFCEAECSLGGDEYNPEPILVFPNPAEHRISIFLPQPSSKIEMVGMSGEVVELIESTNRDVIIDISRFAPGVYTLHVLFQNGENYSEVLLIK
jgi:Secretion system C-terminal sorting domain